MRVLGLSEWVIHKGPDEKAKQGRQRLESQEWENSSLGPLEGDADADVFQKCERINFCG